MVHVSSLSVLGSALVGLSNAAALGTAEEYADGTVHARIMGMKIVRLRCRCTLVHAYTDPNRHNGMLRLPRERWIAPATLN